MHNDITEEIKDKIINEMSDCDDFNPHEIRVTLSEHKGILELHYMTYWNSQKMSSAHIHKMTKLAKKILKRHETYVDKPFFDKETNAFKKKRKLVKKVRFITIRSGIFSHAAMA